MKRNKLTKTNKQKKKEKKKRRKKKEKKRKEKNLYSIFDFNLYVNMIYEKKLATIVYPDWPANLLNDNNNNKATFIEIENSLLWSRTHRRVAQWARESPKLDKIIGRLILLVKVLRITILCMNLMKSV